MMDRVAYFSRIRRWLRFGSVIALTTAAGWAEFPEIFEGQPDHPAIGYSQLCRNVKRWHDGDQIERWVASGLLVAEDQFRKVVGYRHIPALLSAMESAASKLSKKTIAKQAAVA